MHIEETHNTGNMWRHYFPRHHLLAAGGLSLGLVLALAFLPENLIDNQEAAGISSSAPLDMDMTTSATTGVAADSGIDAPALATAAIESQLEEPVSPWVTLTVRPGDTLSSLLQKAGMSSNEIHQLANDKHGKQLAALKAGEEITLLMQDGRVHEVHLERSRLETISVQRNGERFVTEVTKHEPSLQPTYVEGEISSSLFVAGQKAGLPQQLTMKMADIFGYDIDFLMDIQPGDSFRVLFEEKVIDGERVGYGDILAAEFVNKGKTYQALRYTDSDGRTNYFSPEGKLLKKQFLRTPVDFARITSHFSTGRKHPILHKIRAHKGVDYGAPAGTPILSAGDGKVVFAGVRSGFGNVVMVQHGSAYTTLYAHMQKILVKNGQKISQGQKLGTVGKTGLATGPHLHYEFHVNGVAQNPLKHMNASLTEGISTAEKAKLVAQAKTAFGQLEQLAQVQRTGGNTQIALNQANVRKAGNGNSR